MGNQQRRRCVNGDETDAHERFGRRYIACFGRAGVRADTKRRTRRRERREGVAATREERHAEAS